MPKDKYDIEDVEFRPQLLRLVSLTRILKKWGHIILFFLLLSLFALGAFGVLRKSNIMRGNYINGYEYTIYSSYENVALLFVFILVLFGILVLLRFSSLRNEGMIIYEEITDEIDWSRRRKEFIHKPPIETRIIIKEFLKSSDLPFTSGTNGQALYVILFFVILISAIMIKVFV